MQGPADGPANREGGRNDRHGVIVGIRNETHKQSRKEVQRRSGFFPPRKAEGQKILLYHPRKEVQTLSLFPPLEEFQRLGLSHPREEFHLPHLQKAEVQKKLL